MKIISLILAALLLATSAQAEWCKNWTTTNTVLQGSLSALILVDWEQTRRFTASRGSTTCSDTGEKCVHETPIETNPILGERPSADRVNVYMATALIGTAALSCLLDPPYRTVWQSVAIVLETRSVRVNISHGW